MTSETSYWLALAHTPNITNKVKNNVVVKLFELGRSIDYFFELGKSERKEIFNLTELESEKFDSINSELPNFAFLAEDLLAQGYKIIPITSDYYSKNLKKNLGRTYSPVVIYAKGNTQLLSENSIAIVGSRKAHENSIVFTDNVARKASEEDKIVVSGFAKGVDKQALDSTLKYNGKSIIVLPQGITTFHSGYKSYYKEIVNGDLLVMSTYHPKAGWSAQLAMGRNPIIYGLASEIYVAESAEKGGTWSGVLDGLRKQRKIFIRKASSNEINANHLLIYKGGIAVDINGCETDFDKSTVKEISVNPQEEDKEKLKKEIIDLLKNDTYDAKSIKLKLNLSLSIQAIVRFLKNNNEIEVIKGRPLKFSHKNNSKNQQMSLF